MAWPEREVNPSKSARHFYGAEVRRLRTERGWPLARLAEAVHFSPSTMSRVENGDVKVPDTLSEKLDSIFMTDGFFARMLPLARQEAHPAKYQEILTTADQAVTDESYSPMVHGLLQTPDHARRLLRAGNPYASQDEIEERVRARIGRQLRLHSEECRYWFILDESAIRRVIGGPEEMTEQLQAILTIAEQPNVLLQVLPFSAGAHSEYASLWLLTMANGQQLAYEESSRGGLIFEETQEVKERQGLYNRLRAQALSPEESELLIRSALEGLAPMQPNDPTEARQWRKSTYSNGDGGGCIEVDDAHPGHVRDSKDPSGPVLRFTPATWADFVSATVAGEFGNI
ncbi:Scr1 family TA system antitoxin-like transcriptional regulator [Kitasatospora sp. NRRL B-11411]|uniref:helix-turn-helix domain-containing protein n=1 Tax=Kitasatospora sp. NRRL B-11411 TaxID=1463822 RepID=UPI0006906DAB|nr:Scr1 family TA system antitoxin-like transcriptional regulator [Kitasatospora sp. NRRL B-11411]